MEPRTIRLDVADGVATLTLHRPDRRNAISIEMRDEIRRRSGHGETIPRSARWC